MSNSAEAKAPMTDSTLSQIARKMAERLNPLVLSHDFSGKRCPTCESKVDLAEVAIREAMLLALQKAEQVVKAHCYCEENVFKSLNGIEQLKSELAEKG